jgi:D-serine deaminase-like pyridoxal phosphate-dependent protein
MKLPAITKPTLLLDEGRTKRNIQDMAARAQAARVRLRPHFKTHQSAQVGDWFLEVGITEATVSSVGQASYFANNGWDNITIAIPVNMGEIAQINTLARSTNLGLLVDSEAAVSFLEKNLTAKASIWIKIDVGYGRVGIQWQDTELILSLAHKLFTSKKATFAGLLTHAGHSYHAKNQAEILDINNTTIERMTGLKQDMEKSGINNFELSIGDTPCCSLAKDFEGIDEIRPGNFVFYDAMQAQLGTCTDEQISVAVACPVIGKYPQRQQLVIQGGAVHLSKDHLTDDKGNKIFGYVTRLGKDGFGPIDKRLFVSGVSQEHGTVTATDPSLLTDINIGDILLVLPIHSCLTANLYSEYVTLEGKTIPRRTEP